MLAREDLEPYRRADGLPRRGCRSGAVLEARGAASLASRLCGGATYRRNDPWTSSSDGRGAGRLVAVKLGRAWVIDAAELERYRVDSLGRPGRKRKQPPPAPAELRDDGGPDLRPSLGAGKGRLQMDDESDAARRFLLGALLALLALSLIFVAINAILEARA